MSTLFPEEPSFLWQFPQTSFPDTHADESPLAAPLVTIPKTREAPAATPLEPGDPHCQIPDFYVHNSANDPLPQGTPSGDLFFGPRATLPGLHSTQSETTSPELSEFEQSLMPPVPSSPSSDGRLLPNVDHAEFPTETPSNRFPNVHRPTQPRCVVSDHVVRYRKGMLTGYQQRNCPHSAPTSISFCHWTTRWLRATNYFSNVRKTLRSARKRVLCLTFATKTSEKHRIRPGTWACRVLQDSFAA